MRTCQEIIRSAYARSGILARGVNMNASQSAAGLEHLQGLYKNLITGGMFGRLRDVWVDQDVYDAQEGQRVFKSRPMVVNLPVSVRDECTGGMRQPLDKAIIVIVDPVNGVPSMNMYSRWSAQWADVNRLVLTDTAPLSDAHEDHLISLLAVKMLGDVDLPIPVELIRAEGRARLALSSAPADSRQTGQGEFM